MSSNPGFFPDGTPHPDYLEALNRHNNPHLQPSPQQQQQQQQRNIGYNRPSQQHQQQPYPQYNPRQQPHQRPPQQQQQQQPRPSYPYPPNPSYARHQQPQPQQPYPPQQRPFQPPAHPATQPPYPGHPPYPTTSGAQHHQPQPHGRGSYSAAGAAPGTGAMGSSFRPSGRHKALLVGINYKGSKSPLRGCIRDVTFVHHLLVSKFGFRNRDFVILTDEPVNSITGASKGQPTRRVILDSLMWLVSDSKPGDSLWFSFSGHGSQVRDTSGDESDGYDETILPMDYKRAGHIVDDELYEIVRRVCRGARLTVLLDACHSGTGLDLPYQHDVFGTGSGQRISGSNQKSSFTQGIMDMAGALLTGNAAGALNAGISIATGKKKKKKPHAGPDPNSGEVLLFSGCKDNQTSADTSDMAGGLSTGAMTYALIETLEHSTVGDWRNYTYRKLLQTMRQKLRAKRMTQVPQFSTSHPFDLASPFIM